MSIKIIVNGAAGRMGKEIIKIIEEKKLALVGANDIANLGEETGVNNICITDKLEDIITKTEVTIDFSTPEASLFHININKKYDKPAVIGTTGLNEEQVKILKQVSQSIPIVYSPNMSVGVNLLFKLTELTSKILQDGYDIEIIEAHHNMKKDAPSGTALKLLEILTKTLNRSMNDDIVYGRQGIIGERKKKEIGVHAIRGGDMVGEHTVLFAGKGERLELTHKATSRSILAKGAILAAEWIIKQKPGLYSMFDVLGL